MAKKIKVTFNVEETRVAKYPVTIKVSKKDIKALENGALTEDELKDKYEKKILKKVSKYDGGYEGSDCWYSLDSY